MTWYPSMANQHVDPADILDRVRKARWHLQVGLSRYSLTEREHRMQHADAELAQLEALLRAPV